MTAKNFDLLVCWFPGGYSYTNKAVYERGDYKKIAFINHYGFLRWDVPLDYVPGNVLTRIEHDAAAVAANFRLEWDALPQIKKFARLCDMCPLSSFVKFDRKWTLEDKIDFLEYAVFGWVPHSEKIAQAIQKNNIVPRKW